VSFRHARGSQGTPRARTKCGSKGTASQKTLRRFDEPKRKAIAAELHILENAGFIREIKASTWVSNPVIIPKKNIDVCRVFIDYASLNKHFPKDPFPLPRIDQIIDLTMGCATLSFLDAYSVYNQIKLKVEDEEEKTTFITPYGVFSYQVMPFVLKNAGATYQRMMQNCLGSQIGQNIQVYIDDMVITTRKEESLITDLRETFGVPAGQLLGFLVLANGIDANLEKIQTILTMGKPTNCIKYNNSQGPQQH
jgi:hypothetical protein